METKLARISQLSGEHPDMVFTSIGHLINKELLKECHKEMDGKKESSRNRWDNQRGIRGKAGGKSGRIRGKA